jgi:hypothetical protein
MFKSISTVSVLTALAFAVACEQASPDVRDGSVELVTSRAGADADAVPTRLTIEGLDNAFNTQVEVTRDAGSERVSLPAGLYAVNAVPSAAPSDAVDAVVPVQSSPVLVVVTAGRSSTVNVRQVEAPVDSSELAWLDSGAR